MDNCSICETTDDVIRPLCCQEKNTICRKCIDKVNMCPFCRTEKTENLLPLLKIVEAEHRKLYERYAYTRLNIFEDPADFNPWNYTMMMYDFNKYRVFIL